jgi:hypothetical protein
VKISPRITISWARIRFVIHEERNRFRDIAASDREDVPVARLAVDEYDRAEGSGIGIDGVAVHLERSCMTHGFISSRAAFAKVFATGL